jgi:lipopolysaccharide transport system ATP-binding protein
MSGADFDLEFREVSKIYRIHQEHHRKARGGVLARTWRKAFGENTEFVALDNLSFQVPRGETLGIIGHNGAGKSTILKLLSRVTTPTKGEIRIRGRIASLLEVGSGFHPELTGRENVYLSGSILGMRRAEIAKKLDSIIDFAEVRQFIDVPVKRYSSGMFVRLGFSIAAHLEADILLLDEVLAVGDASFQDRCLNRIEQLRKAGITIVFISHDLNAVQRLCERVLLMKKGRVIFDGSAQDAIGAYIRAGRFHHSAKHLSGNVIPARIANVELIDHIGCSASTFRTGGELNIRVDLSVQASLSSASVRVFVRDASRQIICEFSTASARRMQLEPGEHALEFNCPDLPLAPGAYYLDVEIEDLDSSENGDCQRECASLFVKGDTALVGLVQARHTWRLMATGGDASHPSEDLAPEGVGRSRAGDGN